MSKKNILIFDDQAWLAKDLKDGLEEFGFYNVKLISNLKDFFSELDNSKYDLLILDVMIAMILLDDIDHNHFSDTERRLMNKGEDFGEVLFKKIRSTSGFENFPVIFYTAKRSVNVSDINTRYIRKPELIEDIHLKIQELLN